MISVSEAEQILQQNFEVPEHLEQVSLSDSLSRVLAKDIRAERNQPPFDRVAMDGIAIRASDWEAGIRQFKVAGVQAAGDPPLNVKEENEAICIEIMTGAALPPYFDGVIPYEQVTIQDGIAKTTRETFEPKNNIHPEGNDHAHGDLLLEKGIKITSPIISILASEGNNTVPVYKTPMMAIITTGNELVEIANTPLPHQIRRSNAHTLKAELNQFGIHSVTDFHLPDSQEKLLEELEKILHQYDVLILSGGVSKGKFDFLPSVFSDLGVEKKFHRISQKPGKPFWYGVGQNKQQVFALPGNPVSCLVNLRRYVIPLLLGHQSKMNRTLNFDFENKNQLTKFIPIDAELNRLSQNGSGDYFSLKNSIGFLEFDGEKQSFQIGDHIPFYAWGAL